MRPPIIYSFSVILFSIVPLLILLLLLLVSCCSQQNSVVVNAAFAPFGRDSHHLDHYPPNVHHISLKYDTQDGNLFLSGAHFDNNTVLYIEVDVEYGKIRIENCSFPHLVIHNYVPEEVDQQLDRLPFGLRYFIHHDIRHEQARHESPTIWSRGSKLDFILINCSSHWGVKFTGYTYYADGNFSILRFTGGPIILPRVKSATSKHSPTLSLVNSTLHLRVLPAIREAREGTYQISGWVHSEIVRVHHCARDTRLKYTTEEIKVFRAPSLFISGNKFFGGILWVTEEEYKHVVYERIDVSNNMFLDGASMNCRKGLNITSDFAGSGIAITGNRFYGTVSPSYASNGMLISVEHSPVINVSNNFADWRFPLAGMQHGANHGSQSQYAFLIYAGIAERVDVKGNIIIVRKAERYFESALYVDGGAHLEVFDNEIFVNRTRRHMYTLTNWRHSRVHPEIHGIYLEENYVSQRGFREQGIRTDKYTRFIHVRGNVVHVQNHRRPMPPRSEWKQSSIHEKFDDPRNQTEIQSERDKRRERLKIYENFLEDPASIEGHDGYADFLRAAYFDPHHDHEERSNAIHAFMLRHRMPSKIIVENNTFHINSTARLHECFVGNIFSGDESELSSVDVINNRFLINSLASGEAFDIYTLTNATHTIVRENEFNCRMAQGACVVIRVHPSSLINSSANPGQKYGSPGIPDDRTGFRGLTFRRNKIRFAAHYQHTHATNGAIALEAGAGGAAMSDDTSVYIQDNDIRGRGLWTMIQSNVPRTVIENNIIKTLGHLGGGFYDLEGMKYLYLHHDQLERAPIDIPDWHEKTMIFLDLLEKWHHGHKHPKLRNDPHHQYAVKKAEDIKNRLHKPYFEAFMEAQKQHAKSLYFGEHEQVHDDEPENNLPGGEPISVLKTHHKYSVSKSKVDWDPSISSDANNNNNNNKIKNSYASYSKSEVEKAAAEADRIDKLPEGHQKELILSPIFAQNLTFPIPHSNQYNREFSIKCLIVNGKPLEYEEVRPLIPYEDMDHWELALPHNKGLRGIPSNDTVDFGCPELAGMTVHKVPGSANEDL